MIFGSLVQRNGHLALQVLGLNDEVVDYQDMIFGSASGGSGGPMEVRSATTPILDWGSSYYHYDISTFDLYSWTSGQYSGASWEGHSLEIDVSKFWTPTSTSITTQTSVTDFWGSSFSGPDFETSNGHSQSAQSLDIQAESFGWSGLSLLSEQQHSEQSFDYSHFAFGAVTVDTQHSDQAVATEIHQISLNTTGVSGSDLLTASHDAYDSFRFATPTGATQQNSSVHDDLTLASGFSNGSNGSSIETNHSEHSDQLLISGGVADFSSHDVAMHEVAAQSHYDLHLV